MAFSWTGFWAAGLEGTADRMNYCLLGVGLKSEFPVASTDFQGSLAWASDEEKLYYCTGTAWTAVAPGLNVAETIGGVKTFSSIPVLPASDPTADNEATRKSYVDAQVIKGGYDNTEVTTLSITYVLIKTYTLTKSPQDGMLKIIVGLKIANGIYTTSLDVRVNDVSKVVITSSDTSYTDYSEWIDVSAESNGSMTVKLYLKTSDDTITAYNQRADVWLGAKYT
jgi:hypothetical protein